jgi:hypothetical protein
MESQVFRLAAPAAACLQKPCAFAQPASLLPVFTPRTASKLGGYTGARADDVPGSFPFDPTRPFKNKWMQQGRVSSQAFRPTPKDAKELSAYDGDANGRYIRF